MEAPLIDLARRGGLVLLLAVALSPGLARSVELAEGRVQVHGFTEIQLRGLARDFEGTDDWDLAQWWNVLNVEVEAEIAPDGWGPFDLISGFLRLEGRYDCVWTRGCGMFSSANTYGDRARRLPRRLGDGQRAGFRSSGTLFNGDTRRFANLPREFLEFSFRDRPDDEPKASKFFDIEGIDTLFDVAGPDEIFNRPGPDGVFDDPAPNVFDEVLRNCLFGFRRIRGRENGVGHQVLGPWNPGCTVDPIGRIADKPNPLSDLDPNVPVLDGGTGFGALPLRPQPDNPAAQPAPDFEARGIYLPNSRLADLLRRDEFDNPDQDFREAELAWNHGASQQDEKELKELYLDIEFFESRLWIRAGRQTIVWGKTELFRTTDQFNPQDLALASLPTLEEARIGLWSLRGVWSFYDVGPLEDLRLELAMNYDQFEPNDLGRCGEPYSPLPVCDKTYGLFIHGLTGLGIAGEVRPPNAWESWEGIEAGARLEFRTGRFSVALTEFYGYDDLPYQDPLFLYERNVDPTSGRPRSGLARGACGTVDANGDGDFSDSDPACLTPDNALELHSVNQQVFAMICATSVGLAPQLDPLACGQTVFNSATNAITEAPDGDRLTEPTLAALISNLVVGNFGAQGLVRGGLTFGVSVPHVRLNADPGDNPTGLPVNTFPVFDLQGGPHINNVLTAEQMALLGCGPLYFTNCELDGFDLMNAEASALMQSWPGFEGAGGPDWDTRAAGVAQPGTVFFEGGPLCTRFEGVLSVLPGCRGPGPDGVGGTADDDPGYDVNADGSTTVAAGGQRNLVQPFFDPTSPFFQQGADGATPCQTPSATFNGCQLFQSELAALSFNLLMALVALSSPPEFFDSDGDGIPDTSTDQDGDPLQRPDSQFISLDEFDPNDPYRTTGCSLAKTHFCSNVQSIFQVTGLQRNTLLAGGTSRFGRRDFVWQGGTPLVLRYEKRNVLGLSLDWAEDVTKTSWGLEFTWIEGLQSADFDAPDRLARYDALNLTVSLDRPTFINFLNQNRTFFLNSQWFLQYLDGYGQGFPGNGPWNVLATLTIQTGFFRDRFNPTMTFVYDFGSNSGAWLPSVQYRYTENLSVTFGVALFAGRMEMRRMPLRPTALANRTGEHGYRDFVENGVSPVRERDEAFLRVRYAF